MKFKLITSNDPDMFESRLRTFISSLGLDDIIVDIKFSTAMEGGRVEYSALLQYKQTEGWAD